MALSGSRPTMTPKALLWLAPAVAVLLLFAVPAGASAHPVTTPAVAAFPAPEGAVFTMTNAPHGNVVWAYEIGPGGAIIPDGHFSTHGKGTGVSLADQGALALTPDHRWLLAVDAGSNAISVFHVNSLSSAGPLLSFVDRVSSHGTLPVSLTVAGPFVYVLNAGNSSGNTTAPGNIFGFFLGDHGLLFPLPGSSRPLSTSALTGAAEIAFTPGGHDLVVTEKATSVLDTYTVDRRGYATGPTVTPSNGSTPYGFAFGRGGALVVSDAGPGALTSYAVARSGAVTVTTPALDDGQMAACWVATVDGGHYAYTTNAHSSTISTYAIAPNGTLTLVAAVAASTGAADTDMAVGGPHGHDLFVYDAGAGEIEEFHVGAGGSLTLLYAVFALPSTAEGLAAF
jgi:6-phosphogluconolactonase